MSLVPLDLQPVVISQLLTQICSFWKEWHTSHWLSQGHRLGCVRLSQGLSPAPKATWLPAGPWGGSFVLGSRGAVNVCLHTSAYAGSVWISTVFKWAGSMFDQNSCDFSFFFCCHIDRHFSLLQNFVLVCKFSGDKQTQKLLEQGCVEPEKNRRCSFETPNLSLAKSWSPGAYMYIAKPTININAQNVSPGKELRIHSGNKDLQINKKGEKRFNKKMYCVSAIPPPAPPSDQEQDFTLQALQR